MPYEILVSSHYEYRSGNPWQRTVLFSGGTTIPTLVAAIQPLQGNYYDNVSLLDVRANKTFKLHRHQKVKLGADLYNVFNINNVTSITALSGASFGLVTTTSGKTTQLPFIAGRNLQFNMSYSF